MCQVHSLVAWNFPPTVCTICTISSWQWRQCDFPIYACGLLHYFSRVGTAYALCVDLIDSRVFIKRPINMHWRHCKNRTDCCWIEIHNVRYSNQHSNNLPKKCIGLLFCRAGTRLSENVRKRFLSISAPSFWGHCVKKEGAKVFFWRGTYMKLLKKNTEVWKPIPTIIKLLLSLLTAIQFGNILPRINN